MSHELMTTTIYNYSHTAIHYYSEIVYKLIIIFTYKLLKVVSCYDDVQGVTTLKMLLLREITSKFKIMYNCTSIFTCNCICVQIYFKYL